MSGQKYINLSELDFSEFLACGELIQIPNSNTIWGGVGSVSSGEFSFFQTSFYGNISEIYYPQYYFQTDINQLQELINKKLESKTIIQKVKNNDDKFVLDVEDSVHRIKTQNQLQKLVNVTWAEYKFTDKTHPISRFNELLKLNGSIYGKWNKQSGFIGASPEPLFIKNKNDWATKALAGTISTETSNYEKLLLEDQKEQEEHDLVVEDIVTKLSHLGINAILSEREVYNFGPIAHLQTKISFNTSVDDLFTLIEGLSPTAALGGFPSSAVYTNLKDLNYYEKEKDERCFGGVFGHCYKENATALVAIRNIYWNEDKLIIHSGCGVVKDSLPQKELTEVRNKRNSIESKFK